MTYLFSSSPLPQATSANAQVITCSLQAQIKPHFVFNVLSSIKSLYHVNPDSGDYAIDLFSKHLRAQIEATGADLIPFEKELDNIRVFTDLENIRREKDLNIIFNIEYSDFSIPALSLQSFIENAIKYGRTSEKEDGYISISSCCEDGEILLEIADRTRQMTVKTFGSFDCFIDSRVVRFSSYKSKELFALIVAYNGKTLTMNDAISQIWPDTDVEKSKKLYRDAVWRLRKTLSELNFDCVDFRRACLILNKSNICCDFWDYIARKNKYYSGEFMKNYDWSISYLPYLDSLNS